MDSEKTKAGWLKTVGRRSFFLCLFYGLALSTAFAAGGSSVLTGRATVRLGDLPPAQSRPGGLRAVQDQANDRYRIPRLPATNPGARAFSLPFRPLVGAPSGDSPAPFTVFDGQYQTGLEPPDTCGAVSPQFVVNTANSVITVHDRSGNQILSTPLNQLFAPLSPTGEPYDPRVRFDPYGQRFIVTCLQGSPARLFVGVTRTPDPTGLWNEYSLALTDLPNNWMDYDAMGFNRNWIAVSANLPGDPWHYGLWAFDKADLYAGGTGQFQFFMDLNGATLQPAETYDPDVNDLYFMQQDSDESIALYALSGPVGSASFAKVGASILAPTAWVGSPDAPQEGALNNIPTGFDWMMDCVVRNGSVYGTQVVMPLSGQVRSSI